MFVISAEGAKTERQYFLLLNSDVTVHVNCLKAHHDSSPLDVLRRIEAYIRKEGLRPSDEAWLVVDRDMWTDAQLIQLHAWSEKRSNYRFALSNPKFEYWLLLHFEDGNDIGSSKRCDEQLKKYLPNYDKSVDGRKITVEQIERAIVRAKRRDKPPCSDWPRTLGCTTVYKLVESILHA